MTAVLKALLDCGRQASSPALLYLRQSPARSRGTTKRHSCTPLWLGD